MNIRLDKQTTVCIMDKLRGMKVLKSILRGMNSEQ
jgi:hypothetical protein